MDSFDQFHLINRTDHGFESIISREFSCLFLFFTEDYFKRNLLRIEIQSNGRLIFPILIGNEIESLKNSWIDLNNFNVIQILCPINYEANNRSLGRIKKALFGAFEDFNTNKNLIVFPDLRLIPLRFSNESFDNLNFLEENKNLIASSEEIFFESRGILHILNTNSIEIVAKIDTGIENSIFCWISHLKKILIVCRIQKEGFICDRNGTTVEKVDLSFIETDILSVLYNRFNKETYFISKTDRTDCNLILKLNENLNYKHKIESFGTYISSNFFVVKNYVISFDKFLLIILDYDFKFKSSMYIENNWDNYPRSLVYDSENESNLIFIDKCNRYIIFDLNTFSTVGYFSSDLRLLSVKGDKMIFLNRNGRFSIQKICFNNVSHKQLITVNRQFVCKINQLKEHLFLNPYLLPCGNSACFDCICSNFNAYTRILKCNFDSCNKGHKLPRELKFNFKLNQLIKDDSYKIMKELLETGNLFINNSSTKYSFFFISECKIFYFKLPLLNYSKLE